MSNPDAEQLQKQIADADPSQTRIERHLLDAALAAERKPYVAALRALVEAIGDRPPTRDTVKHGSFCALTDEQHARIAEARAILDTEAARP
jgi:hypothetical protein